MANSVVSKVKGLSARPAWYINMRHSLSPEDAAYPGVHWLSHHIPKTAGRSLERSFRAAFGPRSVFAAYSNTSAPERLSKGQKLWIPKDTAIVHGHFSPHQNHARQFPNARRIVWIRDPLDRAISLMWYVLRTPGLKKPAFREFRRKYDSSVPVDTLLETFLTTPELFHSTRIYERYLHGFRRSDFAFIGRTEHYTEDLIRLSEMMNRPLAPVHINRDERPEDESPNPDLKVLLRSEYDFLKGWLKRQH